MAYTSQTPRSDHIVVLSPKKEKALATAITDADLTRRHRPDPSEYMAIASASISDAGLAGLPGGQPTVSTEVSRDASMQLKSALGDIWLATWGAAFCLGSDTPTGAGPYTHTIVPLLNGADPLLTTIYEEAGSSLKRKFVGCGVNKVTYAGGKRGAVQVAVDIMGTALEVSGAMGTVPNVPNLYSVLNNNTVIATGAPGSLATLDKNRISAWQVGITQNLTRGDVSGNGLYGRLYRGVVEVDLSMTVAVDGASDDLVSLARNRTLQGITITVNSAANASLAFNIPNFYWENAVPVVDGNGQQIAVTLTASKMTILKPSASAMITVTGICDEAQFLAAAA